MTLTRKKIYTEDAIAAFKQFAIYDNFKYNGRVAIYILHETSADLICNLAKKYKNWRFYVHDKQNKFSSDLISIYPNLFFFRTSLKKWRSSKDCLLFTPAGLNGQGNGHFTIFFVRNLEDIKVIFDKINILTIRIVQVESSLHNNVLFDKLITDRYEGKEYNFKLWKVQRLRRICTNNNRKWLFKLDGLGVRQ